MPFHRESSRLTGEIYPHQKKPKTNELSVHRIGSIVILHLSRRDRGTRLDVRLECTKIPQDRRNAQVSSKIFDFPSLSLFTEWKIFGRFHIPDVSSPGPSQEGSVEPEYFPEIGNREVSL